MFYICQAKKLNDIYKGQDKLCLRVFVEMQKGKSETMF